MCEWKLLHCILFYVAIDIILLMQSALRILDCFLVEGHKLLFRIALAILKVNEQQILSMSDPVGLFQFLKEVARHTFNVEELFNVSCQRQTS